MDILALSLLFVVAFQAGKHWGYYTIVKALKEVAEEQGLDLEKELGLVKEQEEKKLADSVRKLSIEQHGEALYLFDKESDEFICQGSSVQELAKLALDRKKIELAAVLFDKNAFKFVDGVSTEIA